MRRCSTFLLFPPLVPMKFRELFHNKSVCNIIVHIKIHNNYNDLTNSPSILRHFCCFVRRRRRRRRQCFVKGAASSTSSSSPIWYHEQTILLNRAKVTKTTTRKMKGRVGRIIEQIQIGNIRWWNAGNKSSEQSNRKCCEILRSVEILAKRNVKPTHTANVLNYKLWFYIRSLSDSIMIWWGECECGGIQKFGAHRNEWWSFRNRYLYRRRHQHHRASHCRKL